MISNKQIHQAVLLNVLPTELNPVSPKCILPDILTFNWYKPRCIIHFVESPLTFEKIGKVRRLIKQKPTIIVGISWDEFIVRYVFQISLEASLYPSIYRVLSIISPYSRDTSRLYSVLPKELLEVKELISLEIEHDIQYDSSLQETISSLDSDNYGEHTQGDLNTPSGELENIVPEATEVIDKPEIMNHDANEPAVTTRRGRIIKRPQRYED
jgi:hypothetical protein